MSPTLIEQQKLHEKIIHALQATPTLWGETQNSSIRLIETHGATVLLGKQFAIKVKKPVHFDHMDYSTKEMRLEHSKAELSRNKRTAEDMYIGLYPVYLSKRGIINIDGDGEIQCHFIKMHRFPDGYQLDQISAKGKLDEEMCIQLADDLSHFHKSAEIISDLNAVPDFKTVINQNFLQFRNFCPDILDKEEVEAFLTDIHAINEQLRPLWEERVRNGFFRMGHGDLHLQNICVFNGKARIFDAIEYQDDFAISDILYDLSFLLMDLEDKKQSRAATTILNEYVAEMGWLEESQAFEALKLLPFFLSLRAGIRCHVAANRSLQCQDENETSKLAKKAQQLFQKANNYLRPRSPSLLALGAFSGSGKSTLAKAIASDLAPSPGAIILRTDVIRRKLMGCDKYSPMPQSAYTPEVSERVYSLMGQNARTILEAGHSVILDAVFDRITDQQKIEKLANEIGVPFQGVWLDVSPAVLQERLAARRNDASDATWEITQQQIQRASRFKTDWIRISADGTPDQNLTHLRSSIHELHRKNCSKR
ncbi:AAA family ATPase [Sneathiella sp. P13V-1]|uniref:bifunctional aminoglycoside phosphotransferase/ATP-binding protein n=1 Tax=Sneathiella sp. P13V-1 TaxID=2697366 RepID=UPI00187B27CF|nr:bifunctional aminoglycoside phosphotransferase/ATP-binding protein [Sneathiella sp. P13V-1]MBE7638395.1 AAA family ATPase [Sneathiella sp. P13V-1]